MCCLDFCFTTDFNNDTFSKMSGLCECCDQDSQHMVTLAQYSVISKRLSVRGLHSVAHNKTHAENVASEGSQTVVLKPISCQLLQIFFTF